MASNDINQLERLVADAIGAADTARKTIVDRYEGWLATVRTATPDAVMRQVKANVVEQRTTAEGLGRDAIQALKADAERLAARLADEVLANVSPDEMLNDTTTYRVSMRASDPLNKLTSGVYRAIAEAVGALLTDHGLRYDGWIVERQTARLRVAELEGTEAAAVTALDDALDDYAEKRRESARLTDELRKARVDAMWD